MRKKPEWLQPKRQPKRKLPKWMQSKRQPKKKRSFLNLPAKKINNADGIVGYDPEALGLKRGKYASSEGQLHVRCPYHEGTLTSATFNIHTGSFYCFSEKMHKTIFELIQDFGGEIHVRSISIDHTVNDENEWEFLLNHPVDINNDYLATRLVSKSQIEEFGIKSAPDGVVFPITDDRSNVIGAIKRRYSGNVRYYYGGARMPLWDLSNIVNKYDRSKPLYVTEGIFGALRGHGYGYQTCAVLGSNINKDALKYLMLFDTIVGAFDPDEAGIKTTQKLLKMIPRAKFVKSIMMPDEMLKPHWDASVQTRMYDDYLEAYKWEKEIKNGNRTD